MTLLSDRRGAIMIMGIFMAAIAIGFLYYMVGLGDAILARERMQDAADATAFSSAVIHARGMNLLALLNIIMAASLAILVLLAMLASLLNYGASLLAGAAFIWPFLAGGVGPMRTAGKIAQKAEETAKPKVYKIMEATHKLQGPLAKAVPQVAALNALKMATSRYRPVVTLGTTFPLFSGLPVEDGKFKNLCTKAGEYAGQMASWPLTTLLEPLGAVGPWIAGKLEGATKTVAVGYAGFYCGDGPMPDLPSMPMDVGLPGLGTDAERDCKSKDEDKDVSAACDEYERQLKRYHQTYNAQSGQCQADSADDLKICNDALVKARTTCDYEDDQKLVKFHWRQATKTYRYFVEKRGDKEVVSRKVVRNGDDTIRYKNASAPDSGLRYQQMMWGSPIPCRSKNGLLFPYMGRWNTDPTKPVCEEQHDAPLLKYLKKRPGQSQEIDVLEVTDVLDCVRRVPSSAEMKGERMEDKEKKERLPQEMCNCAASGEEMFQIRSIVIGDPSTFTALSDQRILVATLGKKPSESTLGELAKFSGMFAAAQAEFYFDGTDAPSEWLWEMKWKARMRRLSFNRKGWDCPAKEPNCPDKKASEALEGNLAKAKGFLTKGLNSVIVH